MTDPATPPIYEEMTFRLVWPSSAFASPSVTNQFVFGTSPNLRTGQKDESVYIAAGHAMSPPFTNQQDAVSFFAQTDGVVHVDVVACMQMTRSRLTELRDAISEFLTVTRDHGPTASLDAE